MGSDFETASYLEWETAIWHCVCGHEMRLHFIGVHDEEQDEIVVFEAWCNNCAVKRRVSMSEM